MQKLFDLFNSMKLFRYRHYFIPKPKKMKLQFEDLINILILSFISYWVRLRTFEYPHGTVFDEVHFGNFTNYYIRNEYFFDIHPPLAKMLFAGFAKLSEYDGTIDFADESTLDFPDERYIPLRITPIMFSSLVPAAMYIAMRMLPSSKIAAFTSAFMISIDTSMICEGKYLLTDGTLHLFSIIAVIGLNIWLNQKPNSEKWEKWKRISSVGVGLAFSVKQTAMGLCFIPGYIILLNILDSDDFLIDKRMVGRVSRAVMRYMGPAFAAHFLLWYIHFYFMLYVSVETSPNEYESFNLVMRNETIGPWNLYMPPFFIKILQQVGSTMLSNGLNVEPHPCMSRPKDWPLLTDMWVHFYSDWDSRIDLAGNLFVYYLAFIGVILCVLGFTKKNWPRVLRIIVGYFMSYLPFYGVPRTMFLYHYLIPLMLGCMCFGAALDLWIPSGYWKSYAAVIAMFISLAGFIIISPLIYGYSNNSSSWRILNQAWVNGAKDRQKFVDYMQAKYDELHEHDEEEENYSRAIEEMIKNR